MPSILRAADPNALPRQIGFRPPGWQRGMGSNGILFPDVYNPVTQHAVEVKKGYCDATSFLRAQIAKDVALRLDPDTLIRKVEWHFFPDASSIVGPRQALNPLKTNNIPYIVHLP